MDGIKKRQNAEVRKPDILMNFYRVILDEGIEGASIGKVAKRMKINPSLIIHYFQTRENLIIALVDYIIRRAGEIYRELIVESGDPGRRLRSLVEIFFSEAWYGMSDLSGDFAILSMSGREPRIHARLKEMYDILKKLIIGEMAKIRDAGGAGVSEEERGRLRAAPPETSRMQTLPVGKKTEGTGRGECGGEVFPVRLQGECLAANRGMREIDRDGQPEPGCREGDQKAVGLLDPEGRGECPDGHGARERPQSGRCDQPPEGQGAAVTGGHLRPRDMQRAVADPGHGEDGEQVFDSLDGRPLPAERDPVAGGNDERCHGGDGQSGGEVVPVEDEPPARRGGREPQGARLSGVESASADGNLGADGVACPVAVHAKKVLAARRKSIWWRVFPANTG